MTDQRSVERLIDHLRAHVAELRRMEREGAKAGEVEERSRVISRLQQHLAFAVAEMVGVPRRPQLQ
jgi:hypothetical protein